MKNKFFDVYTMQVVRGLGIIIGGVLLLLHTLGIIETGINLLLILISVGLITYGIIVSELDHGVSQIFKNRNIKLLLSKKSVSNKKSAQKDQKP